MPLLTSLIANYNLNANWDDALGSFNCTSSNISYVSGKIWNAASFNGTTSQMRNATMTLANGSSPYSYNFWVKMNTEIWSGTQWFINLNPDWTNQDTLYGLNYQYNGGTRRLVLEHYYNWPETYYPIYHNVTLGTSNWNMITITYNGGASNAMKIYFNWTNVTTGWGNGVYSSSVPATYQKGFTIGSNYVLSAYYLRSDAIYDDTSVWTKELTSSEVTELYNAWAWLAYPFGATSNKNFFMFFNN